MSPWTSTRPFCVVEFMQLGSNLLRHAVRYMPCYLTYIYEKHVLTWRACCVAILFLFCVHGAQQTDSEVAREAGVVPALFVCFMYYMYYSTAVVVYSS